MNSELLRFNNDQKYLVFDFETCNLNLASPDNKPWQLAFIIAQGQKVLEKHDYFIKWDDLNISDDAAKITGFNRKLYEQKAVDAEKVLEHFDEYLYNPEYINLGHNIFGFDIYIHNIFRNLIGKNTDYSYLERSIDTLSIAKAVAKEIGYKKPEPLSVFQFKLNSLRTKGVKLNLGACCKTYDIDFDPSKLHDALYDIIKNFEFFKKIIWRIDI